MHAEQRGQVLPIFAIAAVALIAIVALAVDYGFIVDQHRNLQEFADHAAVAGAEQLTLDGSSDAKARQSAMIYIRDNLKVPQSSFPLAGSPGSAPCLGGGQSFAANVNNCQLPRPFDNFLVTIHDPGDFTPYIYGDSTPTLSVAITETTGNSLAGAVGIKTSNTGVFAEAKAQPTGSRLTAALYVDGCVNFNFVSLSPVVVDGDVYLNDCQFSSTGLVSSFCTFPTGNASGDIVYGPYASPPANFVPLPVGASCNVSALTGFTVSALSQFQIPTSAFPSGLPGPPASANICGNEGNCGPVHPCKNGTVNKFGANPNNCYDPGVYTYDPSNLSKTTLHVANNLNPGVYTVDVASGSCYTNPATTSCGGLYFEGNTMNANLNGVIGKCWSQGIPAAQVWTGGCPNGLIYDPTPSSNPLAPTTDDPQCTGSSINPVSGGAFNTVSDTTHADGSLGNNKPYSVVVAATNAMGEGLGMPAKSVNSSSDGAVDVTITGLASNATGYNIYLGPAGSEQLVGTLGAGGGTLVVKNLPTATAQHTPIFDNSTCVRPGLLGTGNNGFHNIPHSEDQVPGSNVNQNFGVTFILNDKASLCMGTNVSAADSSCNPTTTRETVLLQPYCAAGWGTGSPPKPPDSQFCSDAGNPGPNLEDGVYVVYGNSIGAVRASGPLSRLGMTGGLYLPRGEVIEDIVGVVPGFDDLYAPSLTVTPGQIVVRDVKAATGPNLLAPLAYYGSYGSIYMPPGVNLVQ